MEVRSAIGRRVARARKQANKTQVQLALDVGVDSQTISKIERGQQTPMGTTLRGLSEALGVSPSWILAEPESAAEVSAPPPSTKARLSASARRVIEEYLDSTHGRSAPAAVKIWLRSGALFKWLGVMSPGWRDVDDLRNILERQALAGAGPSLVARDEDTTETVAYGSIRGERAPASPPRDARSPQRARRVRAQRAKRAKKGPSPK